MVKCLICGKDFKNGKYLSAHLKFEEHVKGQDYYDFYLKKPNEGICLVCGKPTKYINFTRGYQKCCSQNCSNSPLSDKGKNISKVLKSHTEEQRQAIKEKREATCLNKYGVKSNFLLINRSKISIEKANQTRQQHISDGTIVGHNIQQSWKTRHKTIEQYCLDNDCIAFSDLLDKYGQGWLSLDIPKIYINKQNVVIDKKYLPIIEEYTSTNHHSNKSKAEQYIIDKLDYQGTIKRNDRTIIKPKELDIYIPELKLAIEYNGIYWHSIESGADKYVHRNKSVACRNLGIRLIHIFEFEDLDEQIYKVNQLIIGNDLFGNDFTKNSLLEVPETEPSILFKDGRHTIYSA